MRALWRSLIPILAVVLTATLAPPAYGAVTVRRAEVTGTQLRVEGSALASRDITVDGVVMGRSGSDGRFRIARSGYTAPPDCTIDVNDGSLSARTATLTGCTVTQPGPEPQPVARLTPDVAQIGPGYVGSDFTTFSATTTTITFGPDTLGPVQFEITAGQLPDGLRLVDPNAGFTPAKSIHTSVAGTPTTVQSSTFTIRATDANGLQATRTYTIVINPARTLEIVPQPWAPLKVGEFANLWIDGKGGVRPYRWAVSAGQLPPGMSLAQDNADGPLVRVTGTPTAAGSFSFTVRLTDAQASTVTRSFTVTVAPADTSTAPAAPTLLSPANGSSVTAPVTLDWTETFDPTLSANGGYNWQVSTSSTFSTILVRDSTLPTVTEDTVSEIAPGTYFWRVQAVDGQLRASAFSTPRSFTVTTTAQPAPSPALSAVTLSPTTVTSGTGSTGTVTLTSAAPTGGASVSLASSNTAVATVPNAVLVPAGSVSATFAVTSQAVSSSSSATVTATFGGLTRSAALTVNPATQTTDSVSVQRAAYGSGRLRVEATSTSSTVTMRVFVTATGVLIGTLGNDGGGRYRGELSWPSNPQSVTVTSSGGGSATRAVTAS